MYRFHPNWTSQEEKDMAMLKAEMQRIGRLWKDIKGKGIAIEEGALEGRRRLKSGFANLRSGKPLRPELIAAANNLKALGDELRAFAIEDVFFKNEIEKAKTILEQFRRRFYFAESVVHFADAEVALTMADICITARVKAANLFMQNALVPTVNRIQEPHYGGVVEDSKLAVDADRIYELLYKEAMDINDVTRKAFIQILKHFYGHLYKHYPAIITMYEKYELQNPKVRKSAMLE